PAIILSSVVLPQPEGPRRVTIVPFSMARSTSLTATTFGPPSWPGNSLRSLTRRRSTGTRASLSEPDRGGSRGSAPDERADDADRDEHDREQDDAEGRRYPEQT